MLAAQDAYQAAARLMGWALLYAALTVIWWPALLIAIVTGSTSVLRGRRTTDVLATLIETAVDLYGRDLAQKLGIDGTGALTTTDGKAIARLLTDGTVVHDA
jgi:hypothetical protein